MQAVSCLIDAGGSGISHAIGSGGRDLSDDVGGITTFAGLRALAGDSATKVIAVVSKTPGPKTSGSPSGVHRRFSEAGGDLLSGRFSLRFRAHVRASLPNRPCASPAQAHSRTGRRRLGLHI